MKKILSVFLLVCVLSLMLFGCQTHTDNASSAICQKGESMLFGEKNIYYLNEYVIKNGISYRTYQNSEWKTLCPDPLCSHEKQSGCFMYSKRFVRGVLEGNTMFFSVWFGGMDGYYALGSYDLTNMQQTIYVTHDWGSMLEEFVKCGDALYYYLINADGLYDVLRYDLNSKKETVLYTIDLAVSSLMVSEGHVAFGTGVGLYLGDLDLQSGKLENVRLAVPMSRSFIYGDICCNLHDGYVYYLSSMYVPEGESRDSTYTGDYCRFPIDGDISQSETVVQNANGSAYFYGSRMYYLPADVQLSFIKYYFHDQQSGPEDLPENLMGVSINKGGIAYYDIESGEHAEFFKKDNLFIKQIYYMDEEKMIVDAFCTDNVTIGEDRFIEGGYLSYNHNHGYFLINLKDYSYHMLMQRYPDQGAY